MALGLRKKFGLKRKSAQSDGTCVVEVTRQFDAPPERVFDAWLDPATAGKWLFATPNGQMVRIEIDACPAGRFLIVERRNGVDVEHLGEYVEIHRPSRLAFAFVVPKQSQLSTRVGIDIAPGKTGCELKLTHAGVPQGSAAQAQAGWNGVLDGLAASLN